MVDGILGTIALGFDGFVLCVGLGVLTPRAWRGPLALAFGACDAAASACGGLFRELVPKAFALGAPGLLASAGVALAALLALVASRPPRATARARTWLLLPLLASLDNLATGRWPSAAESLATGFTSAALAYAGLRLGALLLAARSSLRAAGSVS
jgi:hypothetical protein